MGHPFLPPRRSIRRTRRSGEFIGSIVLISGVPYRVEIVEELTVVCVEMSVAEVDALRRYVHSYYTRQTLRER